MAPRSFSASISLRPLTLCGLGLLSIAGCASSSVDKQAVGGKGYRQSIEAYASPAADPNNMDPIAATAFWGARYNRDQQSAEIAVAYSSALRKIGSVEQALNVMSKSVGKHPQNADVNLEMGKALIESARAFEAVRYLEMAVAEKSDDWTALSAYGVALDQIGEHKLARVQYDRALSKAPMSANLLNNKGLSYALSGDLKLAERTLRTAAASRDSDARTRQNLALVLAIKGDMQSAERLARSDLPPQTANQNIAYFRALMSQPAYWSQYAPQNFEAPAFQSPSTPTPYQELTPPSAPLIEPQQTEPEDAPPQPMASAAPTPVTNASEAGETADTVMDGAPLEPFAGLNNGPTPLTQTPDRN